MDEAIYLGILAVVDDVCVLNELVLVITISRGISQVYAVVFCRCVVFDMGV